jgi:rhodanese-related sulfurtransferase
MKPIRIIFGVLALSLLATTGWAYDAQLAASYAQLFAPVTGAKAGKELHLMPVETFVDGVKSGKQYVTLDVRTPAELGIFGGTLPNNLAIPLDQLFQPANLDRIPTDKPVVVVCQSGTRASAVGTALRHVGFDNVHILMGGFKALANYVDAKAANGPPEKVAVR